VLLLSFFLSDLWGWYLLSFIGIGFYSVVSFDGGTLASIHDLGGSALVSALAPPPTGPHTFWLLLGVFAVLSGLGALVRALATPNGKKKVPYPLWYSGLWAAIGLACLLYFVTGLRTSLEGYVAGLGGATGVVEPNFLLMTIGLLAATLLPVVWIGEREEAKARVRTAAKAPHRPVGIAVGWPTPPAVGALGHASRDTTAGPSAPPVVSPSPRTASANLLAAPRVSAQQTPPPRNNGISCPRCGAEISTVYAFCGHCGAAPQRVAASQ
jgi:hypothetical protein